MKTLIGTLVARKMKKSEIKHKVHRTFVKDMLTNKQQVQSNGLKETETWSYNGT